MNPKVDDFLRKAEKWKAEFEKLRKIILSCKLTEELKWGVPCYSFEGANVALIHGFKDYCAILFCKGALLKDAEGILIQQTKNVQAARQVRFRRVSEVVKVKGLLKAYILEAISLEKAGRKVEYKNTTEFKSPAEFQSKLAAMPNLKTAFTALTPGRQRAYLLHFSAPKHAKTREARIEKCIPQILDGKGLNDDYLRKRK